MDNIYRNRWGERSQKVKVCVKCGLEYPNNKTYFHVNRQTGDGLHYYCKECRNKERIELYKRIKDGRLNIKNEDR